ncbi:MAG: hypothetical protein ACRDZ5_12375, partial [Acidimicrobiales bacterium]
ISISCDDCCLQATQACEDCVVTFLCTAGEEDHEQAVTEVDPPARDGGIIIDASEARAMRMLQGAGLIPGLRFERRVG